MYCSKSHLHNTTASVYIYIWSDIMDIGAYIFRMNCFSEAKIISMSFYIRTAAPPREHIYQILN